MSPGEARRILSGELTVPLAAVEEAERVVQAMERPREVGCALEGCGATSEVDEATGVALAKGWLSEGRLPNRRYFCGRTHHRDYLVARENEGRERSY